MTFSLEPIPLLDSTDDLNEFIDSFRMLHDCLGTMGLILDPNNIILAVTAQLSRHYTINQTEPIIGRTLSDPTLNRLKNLKPLLAKSDAKSTVLPGGQSI